MTRLLDLRLFELDVLAHDRVVLLEHELVRGPLAVLRRRVEEAGVRGRHQADELAARFTLLRHGDATYGMPPEPLAGDWEGWSTSTVPVWVGSRSWVAASTGVTPGSVVVFRLA